MLDQAEVRFADGRRYVGEIDVLTRPSGHGNMQMPSGDVITGEWKDGILNPSNS